MVPPARRGAARGPPRGPGPLTRTLTIFHVTDVHARVAARPQSLPGLAGLVRPDRPHTELFTGLAGIDALLTEEMANLPPGGASMLVCCGDLVGREMATDRTTRGAITFEAMKLLAQRSGVDASVLVVGNHEVDHGVHRMRELLADADPFVVVAGNLSVDGAPVSATVVTVDVDGLQVAVLGVTTLQTATEAPPDDRPRLGIKAPVEAARQALLAHSAPCDVLLAAVHLFDEQDLAVCSLDGVDLLLGGHTHARLSGPLGARGIHREKAGSHGLALGRAVLQIDADGARVVPSLTALLPPDVAPGSDSPLQRLHDDAVGVVRSTDPQAATAVARSGWVIGDLDGLRGGEPNPLGRTVAQGLVDGAGAVSGEAVHCGFANAGNIRMDLVPERSVISLSALHDTLAYANELVILELSPALLMRVLRTAVANLKLDLAGWLHTAGLRWAVAADGSIGDVFVGHDGWTPLQSCDVVRVATLDFLADGGHHLGFLAAAPCQRTGVKAADAWSAALHARRDGDRLPPLLPPPPLSSVDAGFRCTDTQTVLETLDHADPGAFAWALNGQRSGS